MSSKEKSPEERIVVTGMGMVSPLGNGVEQAWEALIRGESGIRKLPEELLHPAYENKVGTAAPAINFSPEYLEKISGLRGSDVRRAHRSTHLVLAAAAEALQNANLAKHESIHLIDGIDPRTVGTALGSGAGGADSFSKVGRRLDEGKMADPRTGFAAIADKVVALPARYIGARGPSIYNSAACETGLASIIAGAEKMLVPGSRVNVMIAGSTEAQITREALSVFAPMGALDPRKDPTLASSPFDKNRQGFVMGEGAGVVILERLSHALGRKAVILAEITNWFESNDNFHDTQPGIEALIEDYQDFIRETGDFDAAYINAHATGTFADSLEMEMIECGITDKSRVIGISSSKSSTGHPVGAAGSMEFIDTVMAVTHDTVPPVIKLTDPDESTLGWNIYGEARRVENIDVGIKHGLGFGGFAGFIAVRKVAS